MTQFGASPLTGEQIAFDHHLDRLAEQAVDAPVLAPSPASSLGVFASRLYWSGNQAPVAPVVDDPVLRKLLERQRERVPQAAAPRLTVVPVGLHQPVAIHAAPFGRTARHRTVLNWAAMLVLFVVGALMAGQVADWPNRLNRQPGLPAPEPNGVLLSWSNLPVSNATQSLAGLAIAPDGTIWVPINAEGVIEIYDTNGALIDQWGSPGSAPGQFKFGQYSAPMSNTRRIAGIAWDADGNIYVVDRGNQRIQKFDKDRNFLFAFDQTNPVTDKATLLSGIAVGIDGTVYAVDDHGPSVQAFDANGSYLGEVTSPAPGPNQVLSPSFITADRHGHLWIPDCGTNRVLELDRDRKVIATFGEYGSGPGQFSCPFAVAVDSTEHIYVAEFGNSRVQMLAPDGGWLMDWSMVGDEPMGAPFALTIDQDGGIVVVDRGQDRISRFELTYTPKMPRHQTLAMSWSSQPVSDVYQALSTLAIAPDGTIWVPVNGKGVIQIYRTDGTLLDTWGSQGKGPGQFNFLAPYAHPFLVSHPRSAGIAWDAEGNIYVVDNLNKRVQKFDKNRTFLFAFDETNPRTGDPSSPIDIAVGADGTIFVIDGQGPSVQAFDSNGQYLGEVTSPDPGENQVLSPSSITVDTQGNLWIPDCGLNRVLELDRERKVIATFGEFGTGPGQFSCPMAVAVDSMDHIFVADFNNHRVQLLTSDGEWLAEWNTIGNAPMEWPYALAIDSGGGIVVIDKAQNRISRFELTDDSRTQQPPTLAEIWTQSTGASTLVVADGLAMAPDGSIWAPNIGRNVIQIFSVDGTLREEWGSAGAGEGQFTFARHSNGNLQFGSSMAWDSTGNVYVVDRGNQRIEKFGPDRTFLIAFQIPDGNGGADTPAGIAVGIDGTVYVSGEASQSVTMFSPTGDPLGTLAGHGDGEDQVQGPGQITIAPTGEIWIADCAGNRVVHFTAVGEYAGAIGTTGSDAGQFRCPTSVGFDQVGRIYIGDAGNKRIQIFAADGTYLAQWSLLPDGSHIQPAAVAVESDGALFVLNRANGDIVRLDVVFPTMEPTVIASPQP